MMRHDPHTYLAGRRISCSSGFINGTPLPLPKLERAVPTRTTYKRSADFAEKCRKAAFLAWQRRKAR